MLRFDSLGKHSAFEVNLQKNIKRYGQLMGHPAKNGSAAHKKTKDLHKAIITGINKKNEIIKSVVVTEKHFGKPINMHEREVSYVIDPYNLEGRSRGINRTIYTIYNKTINVLREINGQEIKRETKFAGKRFQGAKVENITTGQSADLSAAADPAFLEYKNIDGTTGFVENTNKMISAFFKRNAGLVK